MQAGYAGFGGKVRTQVIHARKAPLAWRIANMLRASFLLGWFAVNVIAPFARWFGVVTMTSKLSLRVYKVGVGWIDYGVVCYRVVTTAGLNFIRDDFNAGSTDITTMNYHGCGTGTTAEAAGDTALVTESTTALNPDSTRATGTQSAPSAGVYRTIGTLTFDGSVAVTEHGILSQAATGGGTLLDRSVFSAVNVVSGDSIQFTYDLTLSGS